MSEDNNRRTGSWFNDEDSGLYGGAEDWLDEKTGSAPKASRKIGHMTLPEDTQPSPALHGGNTGRIEPEEPEIDASPVRNEPEEELADWNETPSGRKKTEPKISVIKEETEEEDEPKEAFSLGKLFRRKAILMAAAGALCALLVFGIVVAISRIGSEGDTLKPAEEEPVSEETVTIPTEKLPIAEVKHLSFNQLSMEHTTGFVSVKEFSQILAMLYDDDYVLVDVYTLADTDEAGNYRLKETIDVPEGKKPLILSAQDVSYPASRQGAGFARKLVVDGDGYIHNEHVDDNGVPTMGDFDVIPLVDAFVREHPDFSFNGAKGVIGLTGYNGILGYRTSLYPETAENPFGEVDVESEKQSAQIVIDALRNSGWRFASNGFAQVSYGSEYSMIEADAAAWTEKVGSFIGGTDLLIFPRDTDIASWAPYTQDNPKYALLYGQGFRYFFIAGSETPGFLQVENEFVRQAIIKIETFDQFRDLFSE